MCDCLVHINSFCYDLLLDADFFLSVGKTEVILTSKNDRDNFR